MSTHMRTQPAEFAAVIRLANCYAALHVTKEKKTFISEKLTTDIKAAQASAKFFAETNKIFYDNDLQELTPSVITVLKHENKWFPAELHPDKITLLMHFGQLDLGGSQQEAINMANVIALSRGTDCVPSIGISVSK